MNWNYGAGWSSYMNCLVALPELVHELDNMHVLYLYHELFVRHELRRIHELLVMRNLGRRHELYTTHTM